MLLNEKDNLQLELILKYAAKIETYLARNGNNEQAFVNNEDLHDLCCYALVQIGEAVHRLSDDFIVRHTTIDWQSLYGMRCYLVHGYESLNYRILWQAIQFDLPDLVAFCNEHYEG